MKLPFLISIPHGGSKIPEEIKTKVIISNKDLFDDGDAFTREIYDVDNYVISFHSQLIARAFVDLNRNLNDLPPKNPDGVLKTLTCYEKPIYEQEWLTEKERTSLLRKYYFSYHQNIVNDLKSQKILFAFDCHSMAQFSPKIAPDKEKSRPLFCLSNVFHQTSRENDIEMLKNIISVEFGIDLNRILINDPFSGGFITQKYGNNPVPWIQIEMNRSLYLNNLDFNFDTLTVNPKKIEDLNSKFWNTLSKFYKYLFV